MKSLKHIAGRAASWTMAGIFTTAVAMSMVMAVYPGLIRLAEAAVQQYAPGISVYTMPIVLSGNYAGSNAVVARWKMPYAARLIGFSATAETVTNATVTADLRAGGTSLLSAPVAFTAGTVATNAVITTSAVANDAVMTAYIAMTGTNAVVSQITIQPTFLRR